MNMKVDEDNIILSTGKEFYANNGLIGIGRDEKGRIEISGGYDQMVDYGDRPSIFSHQEKLEIFEYMIILWREWANSNPT